MAASPCRTDATLVKSIPTRASENSLLNNQPSGGRRLRDGGYTVEFASRTLDANRTSDTQYQHQHLESPEAVSATHSLRIHSRTFQTAQLRLQQRTLEGSVSTNAIAALTDSTSLAATIRHAQAAFTSEGRVLGSCARVHDDQQFRRSEAGEGVSGSLPSSQAVNGVLHADKLSGPPVVVALEGDSVSAVLAPSLPAAVTAASSSTTLASGASNCDRTTSSQPTRTCELCLAVIPEAKMAMHTVRCSSNPAYHKVQKCVREKRRRRRSE